MMKFLKEMEGKEVYFEQGRERIGVDERVLKKNSDILKC